MAEKVKVASPTLVSVAVRGPLEVFTPWLPKVMVVELKEKPAVGTETREVLPPPPQDADHRAMAVQAAARITALRRSG
jgi:hypothetical protein